jgi:hypothetical protein
MNTVFRGEAAALSLVFKPTTVKGPGVRRGD